MAETAAQHIARLTNEKYLIMQDMARPGFQLIMTKLNQSAKGLQVEYDSLDMMIEQSRAIKIQMYRKIVLHDIPAIIEEIMNVDTEPMEEEWTFFGWLKSIQECINDFIDDSWLKRFKL